MLKVLFVIHIYFSTASVSMMITISVGFAPHIYSINPPYLSEKTSRFCKIRSYTSRSSITMYRCFMTMASIDRYMILSDNIYLRKFSNLCITDSVVIEVLIIWIILPLCNLIFLHIKGNLYITSSIISVMYRSLFIC
jgi:hypothetical protein